MSIEITGYELRNYLRAALVTGACVFWIRQSLQNQPASPQESVFRKALLLYSSVDIEQLNESSEDFFISQSDKSGFNKGSVAGVEQTILAADKTFDIVYGNTFIGLSRRECYEILRFLKSDRSGREWVVIPRVLYQEITHIAVKKDIFMTPEVNDFASEYKSIT